MTRQTPISLVGIRFTRSGPVRYFNAGGLDLAIRDRVVAVTERGEEVGTVVIAPAQAIHHDLRTELPAVLRRATDQDEARAASRAPRSAPS